VIVVFLSIAYMSTSGRLAKKVETKRKWEEVLIDYKDPIIYLRYVFVWERPIDFGLFIALVTFGFWFYFTTETTVLSMVGSSIVAWALGSFLTMTANFKVPWNTLVPPQRLQDATGNPVDYYGEVIGVLVSLKYALVDFFENIGRVRITNPTSFIVQTTLFGAMLAFLGSYVSGQVLFFLTFYTILLLPGIIANRIQTKVYSIIEPYIQAVVDKSKYYAQQGVQQVHAQIQKRQNKNKPQSPQRPVNAKKEPVVDEQELVNLSRNNSEHNIPNPSPQAPPSPNSSGSSVTHSVEQSTPSQTPQ